MPKVFVHGNPESAAIWSMLTAALADRGVTNTICLSPPGFGASVPAGFAATPEAYRAWLIAELETIDGPVDLVGHDWGAGHVLGAIAERPDLVRSWATDCAGLVHPDYVWHDAAQAWQTPEVGEEAIQGMLGAPTDDKAAIFESLGMPAAVAAEVAVAANDDMGACVLTLYRGAKQPAMADLGRRLAQTDLPPGLCIIATDDTYAGSIQSMREVATSLDADTVTLRGEGHWWMFSGAGAMADALISHWNRAAA